MVPLLFFLLWNFSLALDKNNCPLETRSVPLELGRIPEFQAFSSLDDSGLKLLGFSPFFIYVRARSA